CSQIVVLTKGSVEVSGDRQAIFHQPSTVGVARLTGCQNIASAIPVDEHRVAVPAWGLILNTANKVAPDVSHVGIRAHFIRPPNEGEAINVFDFSIVQDRQSPFSRSEYLFVKHPAGLGGLANGRHDWLLREQPGYSLETVRQHTCRLCLPPDKILLFGD
ncbi:MAG: hypothetical protein D6B26_02445, partial [Spirochaetaceae bacterium]